MQCESCVFLDLKSGRAFCPFPVCMQDQFDPARVRTRRRVPLGLMRKGESKLEWLRRAQVLRALQEETSAREKVEQLPVRRGVVAPVSSWERLLPEDPRMDETERRLFGEETYLCVACGGHAYLGATCTLDRFCPRCGARMRNAGRRESA